MIDVDTPPRCSLVAVGPRRRQGPLRFDRRRSRVLSPRPAALVSAWGQAVADFGAAWDLSPRERSALDAALGTPMRRLDTLVRELLAEAAGLAVETGRPEVGAWCYAACERITNDAGERPAWDEIAIERSLLESLQTAAVHGIAREAVVWWAVRQGPRFADETPEQARRRTTACALYLAVVVVRAFTADDAPGRERAALVAALGTVIARHSRAMGAS